MSSSRQKGVGLKELFESIYGSGGPLSAFGRAEYDFPLTLNLNPMPPQTKKRATYFGYGSNLWREQMKRRCPKSTFIGVGILANWRWIINERGYANVVPSEGDQVYGFIYTLTADDEHDLDIYEGAAYKKLELPIASLSDGSNSTGTDVKALVYVDVDRRSPSQPKEEYIYRMNKGLKDALDGGIPSEYIETYIRPFIPEAST